MSTQTAPWIILFTPLVSAALILLLGKFSKTLSASLALIAAITADVENAQTQLDEEDLKLLGQEPFLFEKEGPKL